MHIIYICTFDTIMYTIKYTVRLYTYDSLDIVFLLNIIHTFCKYGKEGHVTVPKLNKSFPFRVLFVLTPREKML